MTNKLAIYLGLLIVTALVLDAVLNGSNAILFLAKKFTDLLEWMAFWR